MAKATSDKKPKTVTIHPASEPLSVIIKDLETNIGAAGTVESRQKTIDDLKGVHKLVHPESEE